MSGAGRSVFTVWVAGLILLVAALALGLGWRLVERSRATRHFADPAGAAAVDLGRLERSLAACSDTFEVDRIYRSMTGPLSLHDLRLEAQDPPQLLWITGYEVEMEDGAGRPAAPEFMCHSNLDLDGELHARLFGQSKLVRDRLFTLSQGETRVRFPAGFGLPVMSSEPLRLFAQVLNLNEHDRSFQVRQRVTLHYLRDRDLDFPMRPLFMVGANGYVLLEGDGGHFGVAEAQEEVHGPGCGLGMNAGGREFDDGLGRRFTGHWVVPPGRHEYRSLVTRFMALPFDTTVHHIAVHLHPYAESTELIDRTSATTVFRSRASNFDDRVGLRQVEDLSTVEGIPIHADHEYELVTLYDNTSGVDQDSMAVMFLYLLDREFERPRPAILPSEPVCAGLLLAFAGYLLLGRMTWRRVAAAA